MSTAAPPGRRRALTRRRIRPNPSDRPRQHRRLDRHRARPGRRCDRLGKRDAARRRRILHHLDRALRLARLRDHARAGRGARRGGHPRPVGGRARHRQGRQRRASFPCSSGSAPPRKSSCISTASHVASSTTSTTTRSTRTTSRRAAARPRRLPARATSGSASSAGAGQQTITWDVERGDWSLVVMNADASRRVLAEVEFGGKVDWLGWLALGLAGTAILFICGAALLLTLGIRGRPVEPGAGAAAVSIPAAAIPAAEAAVPYPVSVEAELDPGLSRWRWLVKWFLAIPHSFLLAFLWAAFVGADDRRLLRDPRHRPLPARDLRLQRRRDAVDLARRLLRDERDRHRPLPAVLARRGAGLSGARWRSRTRSGSPAGSCS